MSRDEFPICATDDDRMHSSNQASRRSTCFYQHHVDPNVRIEDVADAVKELIAQREVRQSA